MIRKLKPDNPITKDNKEQQNIWYNVTEKTDTNESSPIIQSNVQTNIQTENISDDNFSIEDYERRLAAIIKSRYKKYLAKNKFMSECFNDKTFLTDIKNNLNLKNCDTKKTFSDIVLKND